jgi:hypothetical protein
MNTNDFPRRQGTKEICSKCLDTDYNCDINNETSMLKSSDLMTSQQHIDDHSVIPDDILPSRLHF